MLQKKQTFLPIVIFLWLIAFGLRVHALNADLPFFISWSQGATTDAPVTVAAARNKTLFGEWILPGELVPIYPLFPAMSWLTYIFFELIGTGYWQANFVALVMGFLCIAFITTFAKQHFGYRTAFFTTLFLTTNYLFLFYNRVSVVYTPLACMLALALLLFGRMPKQRYLFWLGLIVVIISFYIKLLAISLLPVFLYVSWQYFSQWLTLGSKTIKLLIVLSLFGLGFLFFLWSFAPPDLQQQILFVTQTRTFNPRYGWEENLRFFVQAFLQFGIYPTFFVRMLPLFILSYLYVFGRGYQWLSSQSPNVSYSEKIALLYLLGTLFMLLFSTSHPTRYMILLVPPLSLVGGIAVPKFLNLQRVALRRKPSHGVVIFLLAGFTYFYYQIMTAIVKVQVAWQLQTGLGNYRAILDGPLLFQIFFIALLLGFITVFILLWLILHRQQHEIVWVNPLNKKAIIYALIGFLLIGDLFQYGLWARDPQFTIVETSRHLQQDLGENVVLGGAYANVLTIENDVPAYLFYGNSFESRSEIRTQIRDVGVTHIAMESDSIFGDGAFNDAKVYELYPEFAEQVKLVKTYVVRGYVVKVYELESASE